jgi:uncharacterized protein (TIGR00156 family)
MKVAAFLKSGKRRLILAAALFLAVIAVVSAHGEREDDDSGEHREKYAPAYYQTEDGLAQRTIPAATGGFISPLVITSEVVALADETPVRLRGNIAQALKDDQYEFRNNAGTVIVKIGRRAWNGLLVNSDDMVEITGTVNKSFSRRTIRVRTIDRIIPYSAPVPASASEPAQVEG